MIDFDVTKIRPYIKLSEPSADFDSKFQFYYDETNNIKKFYVRENDFNYTFTSNFVLGGLVHEGAAPKVQTLIDSFGLQKTVKEVKFKHIASGSFLDCLRSEKLRLYLQFIKDGNLYVHYSSLNILYWAIVDIVDSAIANSEIAQKLGLAFSNQLKNDLYKLARLEIDSVIRIFYQFEYPNIKNDKIISFIDTMISLFDGYIDSTEFHFGLESLKQILKQAKKNGYLPFIMDEDDHILLKDLSQFYLRPIYVFKNSWHIFDNEDLISETLNKYRILDGESEINNYTFIDSQTSQLIQLSDVFVGIWGKLSNYINTSTQKKISEDIDFMSSIQRTNINLLIDLEDKSHSKNPGFLHSIDSFAERYKMDIIRDKINQ